MTASKWPELSRRRLLSTGAGAVGMSVPTLLSLRSVAKAAVDGPVAGRAKSCIVLYCWGGMSHHESWDLKPDAPSEVRGEFNPIDTATPGIRISEHLPLLAQQTERLAIIRSIHHRSSAHGMGMYWNMTGHPHERPEVADNRVPTRSQWPSLASMVSALRSAPPGVPPAIRLPYPLVDNGTLQAGEYGGWLGPAYDPVVMRTPRGTEFGGVSRDLGSPVLDVAEGIDRQRLKQRRSLLGGLELDRPVAARSPGFDHFRQLGFDLLLSRKVREAFELEREPARIQEAYGDHICGQSVLLSRRLVEAGVPIVTVCCAAGDLNGSKGDHWDTHGDNFNRLKKTMLPSFDRPASALIADLDDRGLLAETLVVFLTDFGRTPRINGGAGRDHYPYVFSVVLAGGGIHGGQVYGSSDEHGAFPHTQACGPNDLHATMFQALGIPLDAQLSDQLGRPHTITDGLPLPLFG
jgi:Protein of unknown function (DUF1501)